MLEQLDMRRDVQEIFKATPHEKQVKRWLDVGTNEKQKEKPYAYASEGAIRAQVMMFSATLSEDMRSVCKKFMQDPMEIYVDDSKLTLHGLQQHYVKLGAPHDRAKIMTRPCFASLSD